MRLICVTAVLIVVSILDWFAGHFGVPHDGGDGYSAYVTFVFWIWLIVLVWDAFLTFAKDEVNR